VPDFAFSIAYAMVKSMEPRIIPRKEHRISRKHVSPNALRTLYRLHSRGFIAYLVGGCVRDLLLGRTPKDFDIGTDATPDQIRRLFRNCVLIGRRFRLAHLRFQDEIVEVSTFRRAADPSDSPGAEETGPDKHPPRHHKNEDGMVLLDNVFGSPEEDALRRDFTINALFYNIADFSVIDYSTGLSDLEQRLIRPIGDPRVRFTEDPVRMLRAVRFAASHDFVIEPAAWEGLCELSPTISRASPARLYEEVQKLFLLGFARPGFSLLEKSGLLAALFPNLSHWIYGNSRRLPLLEANLERLDRLHRSGTPPSPVLLLAALFGPSLQDAALALHRDGTPYQHALDATYAMFMKEMSKTVSIPGRVGGRVRAILALQTSLHRMPPRRPASIIARPEFKEALEYLRISAETRGEGRAALQWWDRFLLDTPSVTTSEPPADEPPEKKRRRRRRKRRSPRKTAA
jgi:poly(A) polymerase